MLFPYIDRYHYVYVTSILIVSLWECWMAHVWGWCNVCKVYFHVRAGRGARGRRRRQGGLRRRVHRHHRRHLVPHAGLHRHARAARQTSVYTRQHRYRTLCTTRHRGTAVLLHARYITDHYQMYRKRGLTLRLLFNMQTAISRCCVLYLFVYLNHGTVCKWNVNAYKSEYLF